MNIGHKIAATGIFLAASLTPLTAASQGRVPCGDRTVILAHLEDDYSEQVTAIGLDTQGRMLEVVSAPSGTWTILVSTAGGRTCLLSSGTAWEALHTSIPDPAS